MKFNKIIMNPPYQKTLHLNILNEALSHISKDGKCVNFSPVPLLTSIRNVWNDLAIKKFNNVEAYNYLINCKKIDGLLLIKLFNAHMQQYMGITIYDDKIHDKDPEKYVETFNIDKNLIKKIMKKCVDNSLKKKPGSGSYMLPLGLIHGHIGNVDFLNIMNMTYEDQLKSISPTKIYFRTEEDRHNFYNFWMSKLGKFVIRLWKVDTHVMDNFIPYFWCKTYDEFKKYFELTDEDMQIIIEKCKEL